MRRDALLSLGRRSLLIWLSLRLSLRSLSGACVFALLARLPSTRLDRLSLLLLPLLLLLLLDCLLRCSVLVLFRLVLSIARGWWMPVSSCLGSSITFGGWDGGGGWCGCFGGAGDFLGGVGGGAKGFDTLGGEGGEIGNFGTCGGDGGGMDTFVGTFGGDGGCLMVGDEGGDRVSDAELIRVSCLMRSLWLSRTCSWLSELMTDASSVSKSSVRRTLPAEFR